MTQLPYSAGLATVLHQGDALRRLQGVVLDWMGLGPIETAWQPAHVTATCLLRRYGKVGQNAPVVLLVPAPIKRAYIFDLLPRVSVVQHCLEVGFSVYMLAWRDAGAEGQWRGLAEYVRSIADAVALIADAHERKPVLIGHSLGGTLAAITASLDPRQAGALVLIEAPLRFGDDTGALAPLLGLSPSASLLGHVLDGAPGVVLDAASIAAAPDEFVWGRWLDSCASLGDREAASIHARVMRWTLDELALPEGLFADIVEGLYREDRYASNVLEIGSKLASPSALSELPVAAVVDATSRLVPPASTLAVLAGPRVIYYQPETGVALQHVGPLVGRRAHCELWPPLTDWIRGLDRH